MKRISMLAVLMAAVWTTLGVGVAFAESPMEERLKKLEGKVATLETKAAASESKIAALEATLKGVTRTENGIDGKPMIDFSGVNVKIDNGAGSDFAAVNGRGNLFVGYDNQPFAQAQQTGSSNIILGYQNTFTSKFDVMTGEADKAFGYGAIMTGTSNTVGNEGGPESESGDWGLVAGLGNHVSGGGATITGGVENHADGTWASISGGEHNYVGTTLGHERQIDAGWAAWVGGGEGNTAGGEESLGGVPPTEGRDASVSGGEDNTAMGKYSSILGGKGNLCETELCRIP